MKKIDELASSLQRGLAQVDRSSFALGAGSVLAGYWIHRLLIVSDPDDPVVAFFSSPVSSIKNMVYRAAAALPGTSDLVDRENAKVVEKISEAAKESEGVVPTHLAIPELGMDREALLDAMAKFVEHDCDWKHGRAFGFVYHGGDAHVAFMNRVYSLFSSTNPLHTSAFPSVQRMEAQVVAMTAAMLHGDPRTCAGTMTSGGTESLLMMMKTYRDLFRAIHGSSSRKPVVVLPITAHPAIEKAAHYLCMKTIYVPVDPTTRRCDLAELRRVLSAHGSSVCLVVGSAPAYPHGTVDPIEEMARVASERKIPMHVDGCLGGFVLPWIEKAGYPVPLWDFRVAGVTSISADVHKYGYSAKGASIIVYRNRELRQYQFFSYTGWPGGLYGSPAAAGSRPGGIIAAAWASMLAMGQNGYTELARDLMQTTAELQRGIREISGLKIIGTPHACIFAVGSDDFDILAVGDGLSKKGWHIERQQHPNSLHFTVTARHLEHYVDFLKDLAEVVDRLKTHPEEFAHGLAPIYGAATKLPSAAVDKFILTYMDSLYKVE